MSNKGMGVKQDTLQNWKLNSERSYETLYLVVIFEVLGYPWNKIIPSRRLL